MMKIIGITGGVGSGKSEVIRFLEKRDRVQVLLADEVGHLLMRKGNRCYPIRTLQSVGDGRNRESGDSS